MPLCSWVREGLSCQASLEMQTAAHTPGGPDPGPEMSSLCLLGKSKARASIYFPMDGSTG